MCVDPNPKWLILVHVIPDPESSLIDDAIDVAKSLCNASALAALLILEPVVHSSVSQLAIVKKRRYLEDKVLSLLVSASSIVKQGVSQFYCLQYSPLEFGRQ